MKKIKALRVSNDKINELLDFSLLDDKDTAEEILITAENYGDFYDKKDPKGAVKKAIRTIQEQVSKELLTYQKPVEKELAKRWKETYDADDGFQPRAEDSNTVMDRFTFQDRKFKEDMLERLVEFAVNSEKHVKSKDAKGAVDAAIADIESSLETTISELKSKAIKLVKEDWE